jgi:thioredoxin 1
MVAPVVEQLASEFAGKVKVVKLNTDENQQTAETYGIMSIPTLAIFKNGQVVDGVVGAVPKNVLKEKLNKYAQEVTVN